MTAGAVEVSVESTANRDDPSRPLFRAEVRDRATRELVDATAWTVHPRLAIADANDLLRIHNAWEQLRAELAGV